MEGGLKAAVLSGRDGLQVEADELLAKEAEKALPKIQAKVDGLQARFQRDRGRPAVPARDRGEDRGRGQ